MRLVKTLPILLSLGAALGSVSAWALPNDQQQPIRIQADDGTHELGALPLELDCRVRAAIVQRGEVVEDVERGHFQVATY